MKRKNLFAAAIVMVSPILSFSESANAIEFVSARETVTAWSAGRGTSVNIPEATIINLCGDWDDCALRMGMNVQIYHYRLAITGCTRTPGYT